MFWSRLISLGHVGIRVHVFALDNGTQIEQLIESLSLTSVPPYRYQEEWHLIMITPNIPNELVFSVGLPESGRAIYRSLHKVWATIHKNPHRPAMELSAPTAVSHSDPRDEFVQGFRLLSYKQEDQRLFFSLVTDREYKRLPTRISQCIYFLATWWYVLHDGLLLHGAAAAHNRRGYLFLGGDGAGKSSIAFISASIGVPILSDDLAFVIRDTDDDYTLAAAPSLSTTFTTHPQLRPSLRGVFLLVKDNEDRLIPLPQTETARVIFQSFSVNYWTRHLPPRETMHSFNTACDIARRVPGYELHFRKSPDFWDVIDAELGN